MNRRVLFAVLAVGSLALVATGCEKKENNNNNTEATTTTSAEKKLQCEITEDDEGNKETVKFVFEYKGDKMATASVSGQTIYKDKIDEKAAEEAKKKCTDALAVKNRKGYTCNTQTSGKLASAYWKFTIADLNEDGMKLGKEIMDLDKIKDSSFDSIKSDLETAGYKCK
jgi:hypothetical protein